MTFSYLQAVAVNTELALLWWWWV